MFSLDRISNFSKDIALINEKKENITYSQLLNYSDKISKNINKRSLIFILCSNTFESIILIIFNFLVVVKIFPSCVGTYPLKFLRE